MKRRRWILLAVALVIVSNLVVLIGVARNRSGEPEATVRLTERELGFLHHDPESSGMILGFRLNRDDEADWLDRAKLETLGFDCSLPVTPRNDAVLARISYC